VTGFAIKQYQKDRKKGPKAPRTNSFKKKIKNCFNCGKKGHFVKKCRDPKANAAKLKEIYKRPTAKANAAEPNRHELLL
jgi:Zinc knuckle